MDNDIDPAVVMWVREFPQALASYLDEGESDNPYIFNPRRAGQNAFVTPRSLEKASDIAKQRDVLGDTVALSALSGCIGEAAARDMEAFFLLVDSLPSWASIIADPTTAKVPNDVPAKCMTVFRAINMVDKKTLTPWLVYLKRLDIELQALFCRAVIGGAKQQLVVTNRDFVTLVTENHWTIG